MAIDPVYAVKGARVSLIRGVVVNSNIGPQEGGPLKVKAKEAVVADASSPGGWRPLAEGDDPRLARVREKVDEKGAPVWVDNPKPPAAGTVINIPDQKGKVPVKWPDGSWSNVPCGQLDLIEKAPEQQGADPVQQQNDRLAADAAGRAKLATDIDQLKASFKDLAGEVTDLAESLGKATVEAAANFGGDIEARLHEKLKGAIEDLNVSLGKRIGDAIDSLIASQKAARVGSALDSGVAAKAPEPSTAPAKS